MMRTRPRSICLSILAAVLVWCGCGSPPANADEPVVLQMNSDIPGAHPLNLAWQAFADQVGKDTGGAVTIKFFPNGQLYNGPRSVEAVATGALALTAASTPTIVGLVPAFDVFQLPYLAPSTNDWIRLSATDLPLFQYLAGQTGPKGVVLLPCPWWGAGQWGIMLRQPTPIKAFADIKGMKIRSVGGPLYASILRDLGASPIDLAPAEVTSALQTGAIDGAMGTFAFFATALSDSAKGAIDTGTFTLGGYFILANKDIWDKIPTRYQQIVLRDLQNSHRSYSAGLSKSNDAVVAKLKATGHWIYEMTPQETASLTSLTKPLWQDYSTKQPAAYAALVASRKRLGLDK